MAVELRPLSLGELLDRTFTHYRNNFWTFVGIVAPAQALVVITTLVVMITGITSLSGFNPQTASTNPAEIFARLIPFYLSSLINAIVGCFAMTVAAGATSAAVSKITLGERVSIGDSYRSLSGQVGRLAGLFGMFILIAIAVYLILFAVMFLPALALGFVPGLTKAVAGILAVVLVIAGGVGGIILAFRFFLRYTLSIPALVLEHLRPIKALKRSRILAKGSLGRIFLACLLMILIVTVVTFTCEMPFWVAGAILGLKITHNPLWLTAPGSIAGGVGSAFGYPLALIVLPLFYFDARVRKEGYDLQIMMPPVDSAPAEAVESQP